MYRRSDPRWNRTIQHIADNIEHANESTQEHLWTFTHDYVNPCFSSITQCLNTCTAPCFPSRDDRRRHRGRTRGRAEMSFDFYDDWEEDENDGLLGWGNDNLDRLLGGGSSSNYGSVSQPGRQRAMSYGTRNRDPRFNTAGRRKSAVQPHDGGPDPTIIPSSSYFGFLGRLPFKIGGKGLRYKPSAADLVEHPGHGQARRERRDVEEEQPLIEDSEEDEGHQRSERKGHRRLRSHTSASGHTTDSLSSRGDIFPSEDELDDAVPLDDEFTMALERRTTGQWHDDVSSAKTRSTDKSKKAESRVSTRTASSRNTLESGRKSTDDLPMKRSASATIEEAPTLADLKKEEERIQQEEEREIERKRQHAQQLALRRGLASDQHLNSTQTPSSPSSTNLPRTSSSPHVASESLPPAASSPAPPLSSPATRINGRTDSSPVPNFDDQSQTAPDSGAFHVDESDLSSFAPTPNRPSSLRDEERDVGVDDGFVPAMLPHFHSKQPD